MMQKLKQLIAIFVAVILKPFYKIFKKNKPILLVGGHEGALFTDNGKAMYHYLIDKQPNYQTYWVINHDSPDFEKINNNVLIRGTVKSYLYYLLAEGVFFSHSASDLAPVLHRISFIRQPTKVYLEHGVAGLKKVKGEKQRDGHEGPVADIFIAVSEFEKNIKIDHFKIPEKQIYMTGMARFDLLIPPSTYRREIIYLPTWREWLVDLEESDFLQSDFFSMIKNLVNNESLTNMLKKNSYQLKIYIHFYFHRFIKEFDFDNKYIEFLPISTEIQDYIINSELMITDYSSVAWDFFYLNKPVIFYQPDIEVYEEKRGAYLDLSKDLFGPQVLTEEDLVNLLHDMIEKRLYIAPTVKREKYFNFFDSNNSERIFEAFQNHQKSNI